MFDIIAYTDGACSGNNRPGKQPGGWGVTLLCGSRCKDMAGGHPRTTSNRMELVAIYMAIRALKGPANVTIHTDSQNAIGWLCQGWKRKDHGVRQICGAIDRAIAAGEHKVQFVKVKAHSGDAFNNHVDRLAVEAIPA
jgi:ribonuclease HI